MDAADERGRWAWGRRALPWFVVLVVIVGNLALYETRVRGRGLGGDGSLAPEPPGTTVPVESAVEGPAELVFTPEAERSGDVVAEEGELVVDPGLFARIHTFRDAAHFLEAWWGEEWDRVREENPGSDGYLARFRLARLRPWEAVRDVVMEEVLARARRERETEAHLVCRDERGFVDLKAEELELRGVPRDFAAVRPRVAGHVEALRVCGERYWDALELAVRDAFEGDRVEHHPILGRAHLRRPDALWQCAGSAAGWSFHLELLPEVDLALGAAATELQTAQRECIDALSD